MKERTKNILTERLPYYLFGLTIGLVLLGFIQRMRSQAHQTPPAQPEQQAPPADPIGEQVGTGGD